MGECHVGRAALYRARLDKPITVTAQLPQWTFQRSGAVATIRPRRHLQPLLQATRMRVCVTGNAGALPRQHRSRSGAHQRGVSVRSDVPLPHVLLGPVDGRDVITAASALGGGAGCFQGQSCWEASRAPSVMARILCQTTLGSTV